VKHQTVETANGQKSSIDQLAKLQITMGNYVDEIEAYVFQSKFDLILGNSWLKKVCPVPDWFEETWSITQNGKLTVLRPSVINENFKSDDASEESYEANYLLSAKQVNRMLSKGEIDECYLINFGDAELKGSDNAWADQFEKMYPDVFKGTITSLPPERDVQNIIETGDAGPVSRPPYRMSPLELKELKRQIDDLLKKGLIEPCSSEWGSPVLFIKKPNGDLRLCCDYRLVNKHTISQKIPLPRVDECLERLHKASYFTSIDLYSGFHQQRLSNEDSLKTTINTRYGQYRWKVIPFGLKNSGPAFQRMMNTVLAEYLDDFVLLYLDDILVFDKNEEDHKKHVSMVLKKLEDAKLIVNMKKCKFNQRELTFLGYHVSSKGVLPSSKKVDAISSWPTPSNVQQVRQFIGMVQYYRKFIQGYSDIAHPLTELTKGTGSKTRKVDWSDECQASTMTKCGVVLL